MFWIGLALFGGTRVHRLHGHGTLTFHLPFIVAAMALGGPTAGALVALLGTIERREIEGEMPWYGAVSNHAHLALGAVVGGVVLLGSEAALRASLGDGPEVVLASLVIGSLVFGVVAAGLAEGTIILRDRLTLHEATRYFNTTFRLTAAAEVVVGWILVLTYTSVGWWAALITAGLVLVIWQGYDAGERARHDPLTGLLSRAGYDVRVEEAVRAAERNARGFAAIAFDLDGFGAINNKHGHAVGDDVIREVGARIHAEIRLTDAGVRLGWRRVRRPPRRCRRCGRRRIGGPPDPAPGDRADDHRRSIVARRRVVRRAHRRVRGGGPAARRDPPHDRPPDVPGQVLERWPQPPGARGPGPPGRRPDRDPAGSPAPRSPRRPDRPVDSGAMILRIVLGRLLIGDDAAALADMRDRITTAARTIRGLESLIIGARLVPEADRADRPIQAVFVSVWRDAEQMLASTGIDEEGRFMGGRLALPFEIERADHYEVLGRTFAALPPESLALLRVLRVRAREHDEARLVATLRGQQPRLVELGLVATHLGRRFVEAR